MGSGTGTSLTTKGAGWLATLIPNHEKSKAGVPIASRTADHAVNRPWTPMRVIPKPILHPPRSPAMAGSIGHGNRCAG